MQTVFKNFVFRDARILIVDDEAPNLRQLERILDMFGFTQVRSTTKSQEAVEIASTYHPDIVLLDLHMPEIDGFGVMEQLTTLNPIEYRPPVLILTGDTDIETKRRALSSGANDLVLKPFDHFEVGLRIKNLLETRYLQLALRRQNEDLEHTVKERTAELENTLATLKAAQEQMVRQERLKALGLMASGIAHDFNNSLTMMLGYSELLMPYLEKNAEKRHQDYLRFIIEAAQDASQVVGRLREFYRTSADTKEKRTLVKLEELVPQVISFTSPKWSNERRAAGVQIEIQAVLEPVEPVLAHAAELREVLTNLIFNAVDAMPNGGTITVRLTQSGGRVIMAVEDTGQGMTEVEKARCLEPFFSTKGNRGTGLGLSVVYGIVERHQGKLDVESELGQGTTMRISFPVAPPSKPKDVEATTESQAGLRILVVDDQENISSLLSEHLQGGGHTTATCQDGREALEIFRRQPFDLVITDHARPEMSGVQLARHIKELAPTVPVIMLTGFGENSQPDGEYPESIDLVLQKPVTVHNLRKALCTVLPSAVAIAPAQP